MATSRQHVQPRFLTRFSCIGTACEDTCCQGWRVTVDERSYLKLKAAMDAEKQERERFRAAHQRCRGSDKNSNSFAVIQLKSDGSCPLLDVERLCSVQRRYGAEVLSTTCSVYPRLMSLNQQDYEASASLSCPEVARQALLAEDAMDLVPLDEASLSRVHLTQATAATTDSYTAELDDLRGFVLHLLGLRQYSIGTRLFFVTYFANRTQRWFHSGQTADVKALLQAEMQRLMRGEILDEWQRQFAGIAVPAPVAASLVVEVLRDRLTDLPDGGLRRLIAEVLLNQRHAEPAAAVTVSAGELWMRHEERKAAYDEKLAARFDLLFENYAKNYWFREWYTKAPNLFLHTRRLLIRIAVLRFLLVSHPALPEVADDPAAFDRLAVEVFYRFSRGVEHSKAFLARIETLLDAKQLSSIAHSIFLLKF